MGGSGNLASCWPSGTGFRTAAHDVTAPGGVAAAAAAVAGGSLTERLSVLERRVEAVGAAAHQGEVSRIRARVC